MAGQYGGMYYVLTAMIGLVSGVTSGLFGIGGGIVMVPAMLLLLNVPKAHVAVGTSLAVIIPTALMGTWQHQRHANIDWAMVAALAPTAICGGYLGVWLGTQLTPDNLKRAFGVLLILVGLKLVFGR